MANKGHKNDKDIRGTSSTPAEMVARYSAPFLRFCNVELSGEDKEQFIVWAGANNFFDVLGKHAALGRTFSVKYDFKQRCYLATTMERDTTSENAGLMASARAGSPDMALWRLLFILDFVLGEGKWQSQVDISGDRW